MRAMALFDHEEVGSESAVGAGGPVMLDTIRRVAGTLGAGQEGAVERAMQRSFVVSSDMAHAVHPNYADRHEPGHRPAMHGGVVIKHNCNQRYATTSVTAALFREVGARLSLPSTVLGVPCSALGALKLVKQLMVAAVQAVSLRLSQPQPTDSTLSHRRNSRKATAAGQQNERSSVGSSTRWR